MMHSRFYVAAAMTLFAGSLEAQAPAAVRTPSGVAPAPATKMEAFKPSAGSVVIIGFTELGTVPGITVDAREMRDGRGAVVRGVVVEVHEGEYREERAFIDVDELPELIKGIDALLNVTKNPTAFSSFEVRYTTKGELQLTAFNTSEAIIRYAVQAGRVTKAQIFTGQDGMRDLRGMFATAVNKLFESGGAR